LGIGGVGDRQVPYSFIAGSGLESDAITAVLAALERALAVLGLAERTDPLTMIVANKLIELAKTGERDPQRLCDLALRAIERD
jgi:hypothetical protein